MVDTALKYIQWKVGLTRENSSISSSSMYYVLIFWGNTESVRDPPHGNTLAFL